MNALQSFKQNGLIQAVTNEDLDLSGQSLTFYCGFDPTSDSLHLGHLFAMTMMRRLQLLGHKPIAVVGGATGMIGDPSGKSKERVLLTEETIAHNSNCIALQLGRFIDLDGDAILVNNMDWTRDCSLIHFLRDIGKNFRLSEMIARESVQKRLQSEEGISFTEFTYQILQSFDYLHLYQKYGCTLQMGGSDQWGNITAGIDLVRKVAGGSCFGLTIPLITGANGQKFGKTEDGTLWLDGTRTSPYKLYQYFLQTDDSLVIQYLRYFTFLESEEVLQLQNSMQANPEKREAQKALAREIVTRVHGEAAMDQVLNATSVLFGAEISGLDDETLNSIFEDVPSLTLSASVLDGDGVPLLDVLVQSGLVPSKGQGRQSIKAGGIYLNNRRVLEENLRLTSAQLISKSALILRAGKKNYCLVRFN